MSCRSSQLDSAATLTQGYKGYVGSTGTLLNSDLQLNVDIAPDLGVRSAPGYLLSTIYTENFDLSDGDFTVTKTANYATPTWAWGQPASGPGQAHSPTSLWATKLDGDYSSNEDSYLVSPVIDLSAYTGQAIILNWWQWLQTEYAYDVAMVQASTDGGSQWRTAHEGMSGDFDLAWTRRGVVLDSSYAVANFRFRFKLHSDPAVTAHGWYIDDVTIGTSCDALRLRSNSVRYRARRIRRCDPGVGNSIGAGYGWLPALSGNGADRTVAVSDKLTYPVSNSRRDRRQPLHLENTSRRTRRSCVVLAGRGVTGRHICPIWPCTRDLILAKRSDSNGPPGRTPFNVFGLGLAVLGVLGAALCLSGV